MFLHKPLHGTNRPPHYDKAPAYSLLKGASEVVCRFRVNELHDEILQAEFQLEVTKRNSAVLLGSFYSLGFEV